MTQANLETYSWREIGSFILSFSLSPYTNVQVFSKTRFSQLALSRWYLACNDTPRFHIPLLPCPRKLASVEIVPLSASAFLFALGVHPDGSGALWRLLLRAKRSNTFDLLPRMSGF